MPEATEPLNLPWWATCSDLWHGWRNRLLRSRLFQRRAAAFWLTRPVARRRARALFDLVAGFVYSQVLLACVRLRLFDMLAEGPQTLDQLAARLRLPHEATQRLLDAATSLQLLEQRGGGRWGLGSLGATMVDNTAVAAMVEHHAALYADLADPVALLRANAAQRSGNALARYWAYDAAHADAVAKADGDADADPDAQARVKAYSRLMAASQPLVADEIIDAYPLHRHRCLLDVGGGDGSFLASVAQRVPALQLLLFDLPAVASQAQARFDAAGLARRARAVGGSFFDDPLPTGADIASLVRVLHDHDDNDAMRILRSVHAALPAGGSLLVAEPMAGTAGAEAMGDAYFGFYLWAMGRGKPRSAATLQTMLQQAGFDTVQALPTHQPLQTRLLLARCHR